MWLIALVAVAFLPMLILTGHALVEWFYLRAPAREAVSADTPEQDSGTPQSGSVVQHDSEKGEAHDG